MTPHLFTLNGWNPHYASFQIEPFINKILELKGMTKGHIDFSFVSSEDIIAINKSHLKRTYVTDVITYNYGTPEEIEGDVYICLDKVIENAKDYEQDPNEEIKLVLVHSILHLLDYRDYTEEEKTIMYREQDRLLELIRHHENH